MKQIKAILQPHILSRVMHALHELPHFPGATVIDASGQGRGRGESGEFVVTAETVFFRPNKLVEIVATDAITPEIVGIIQRTAHTGTHGDGVIIVTEIAECLRIRTGEVQNDAI